MKNVKLIELTLTNFKGQSRTINFQNHITNIYGDNGTGKSANFDAFFWLLFGKDQFDRKDYNILTVDPETKKVIDKVDSEVSAVIEIEYEDGNETITLKRILHQNWERPRGTEEQVYKGNETLCYYNDVPLKVGEYQKRIASIIDETVFKLITNPAYFLFSKEMTWQKQRVHLLEMAGTISDTDIAGRQEKYRNLLDRISGKTFDEYRKTISARKKKLKEDLDQIQPRIDQTARLMPRSEDFDAVKVQIAGIDKEICEIDDILSNERKALEKQHADIREKRNEIAVLEQNLQDIVNQAKASAKDTAFEKNAERRRMKHELSSANEDVDTIAREITTLKREISSIQDGMNATERKMQNKRDKWTEESNKTYDSQSGCLICPIYGTVCADTDAVAKHEDNAAKALESFNQGKIKLLSRITEEGQELAAVLEEHKISVAGKSEQLAQAEKCLSEAVTILENRQKQLDETAEAIEEPVIPENIPEWVELNNDIKHRQEELEKNTTEPDNSEIQEKKRRLMQERDNLKLRLADKEKIETYKAEIANLEASGKELSQQIADLEKDEFLIAEFNKIRIEECKQRVNSLFSIVDFQLYDTTLDGNESEACIPKNKKGVYINSTNTAEKINAGLDIIKALCRFHGITAPIFIDSGESINKPIPMDSQIIRLIVTKDKELKVS